eukprot:363706-Chlamydomonas_euryale.AAC.4
MAAATVPAPLLWGLPRAAPGRSPSTSTSTPTSESTNSLRRAPDVFSVTAGGAAAGSAAAGAGAVPSFARSDVRRMVRNATCDAGMCGRVGAGRCGCVGASAQAGVDVWAHRRRQMSTW